MVNMLPDITYLAETMKQKCSEHEWSQRTEKKGEAVGDRTGTHLKGRINRSGIWTQGRDEGWASHNGWFQVHLKGISVFKKYIHLSVYFQCVCTCLVCVFTCMCMHVEVRGWHWYVLFTVCLIFETGSLTESKAGQPALNPHPIPSCPCFSKHGDYRAVLSCQTSTWVLATWA